MSSKEKRRFNSRQKVTLFLHAQGFCRLCGAELAAGWHGDHIKPFSRSGATDISNGQALCAACNLKKSDKETAAEAGAEAVAVAVRGASEAAETE